MKVAKIKKQEKHINEEVAETYSISSLIKISSILIFIFAVFYIITVFVVRKPVDENNIESVVLDANKITVTQILNRPENQYYVLAIKDSLYNNTYMNTNYSEIYNNYISNYKQKEGALSFYFINLDDALNKTYLGNETNISNKIEELKFSDEVLIKVKNGEILEYYIGKNNIIEEFINLTK